MQREKVQSWKPEQQVLFTPVGQFGACVLLFMAFHGRHMFKLAASPVMNDE